MAFVTALGFDEFVYEIIESGQIADIGRTTGIKYN